MALFPRFGFVCKLFGKAAPVCKPADVSDGVGLSNIRERLDVIYGSRGYRFSRGRGDGGYEVAIRLPLTFVEEDSTAAMTLTTLATAAGEEETPVRADPPRAAGQGR